MSILKNLPTKDGLRIVGESRSNGFRIFSTDDTQICLIGNATPNQTASHIALAIAEARDAGYEQAKSEIRMMLGITN